MENIKDYRVARYTELPEFTLIKKKAARIGDFDTVVVDFHEDTRTFLIVIAVNNCI